MEKKVTPNIPEMFQYTHPKVPDDCQFIISPSAIASFFNYPKIWYQENYLKETPTFKGNTSSVIGTVCHWIYEQYTKKNHDIINREYINKQIDDYLLAYPNEDIDVNEVKKDYPLVSAAVVNRYLQEANSRISLIRSEEQVICKIMEGVYVAGTCDRLEGDTIVDFKNVSTKPNESSIPFHYKIQLLAYAKAYRAKGYEINRIRLVYGVRPTAKFPARCVVVTEAIDFTAEKLIDDTLKLIGESVLAVKANPKLTHLIFKSMDLKE